MVCPDAGLYRSIHAVDNSGVFQSMRVSNTSFLVDHRQNHPCPQYAGTCILHSNVYCCPHFYFNSEYGFFASVCRLSVENINFNRTTRQVLSACTYEYLTYMVLPCIQYRIFRNRSKTFWTFFSHVILGSSFFDGKGLMRTLGASYVRHGSCIFLFRPNLFGAALLWSAPIPRNGTTHKLGADGTSHMTAQLHISLTQSVTLRVLLSGHFRSFGPIFLCCSTCILLGTFCVWYLPALLR